MGYDSDIFSCKCNTLYDRMSKEIIYSYLKDCKYVLDAGTGTGRFAIYLAQRGINVVAADSSKEMIEIAKKMGTGVNIKRGFSIPLHRLLSR